LVGFKRHELTTTLSTDSVAMSRCIAEHERSWSDRFAAPAQSFKMLVKFLTRSETATKRNRRWPRGRWEQSGCNGTGSSGVPAEPACHAEFSCHSSQSAVTRRQFFSTPYF